MIMRRYNSIEAAISSANLQRMSMTVFVFGLPGSGKSYFVSRLAARMGARYINSDLVRKAIISNRTYSQAEKESVYNEMLVQMKMAIIQHQNVVLDATFYTAHIRKRFLDAARGASNVFFIEVIAGEPVI